MEGLEGFHVGLLHPLSTPGQLLALLAFAALFGLAWPHRFAAAWGAFAAAALAGVAAGQAGAPLAPAEPALLALALLAAAAAALVPTAPERLAAAAVLPAAGGGLLLGLASTPDPGPLRATAITLAGAFAGANLALLLGAAAASWLRDRLPAPVDRLALRVAAAWIGAAAALMFALDLAPA